MWEIKMSPSAFDHIIFYIQHLVLLSTSIKADILVDLLIELCVFANLLCNRQRPLLEALSSTQPLALLYLQGTMNGDITLGKVPICI